MAQLIVCEKPAAAKKIAEALAEGKVKKIDHEGVSAFQITHKGQDILIGCAVGHLFNLAEKKKHGWTYPSFDIEWKPSYETTKSSQFTKKYLDALTALVKHATTYINACDWDQEGEVIFKNILTFICKQKDAKRMHFSTLTKEDLVKAYEEMSPHIDRELAEAGETRHFLDHYYGINLSRALTLAVKAAGMFKLLSIGRVQGPALKIVADREREIKVFVPEPYWELSLTGTIKEQQLTAWHIQGKFTEQKAAEAIFKKTKGKPASVAEITEREMVQPAPPPFDLTTLQTEAYRCFGISPKETLSIAQDLYTAGLISYPRTSSQKLPPSLGFEKIMKKLSVQQDYRDLCASLLKGKLRPNEGKKTDPAHPAIFPTGETKKLTDRQAKIYRLVTHRFLATFAPAAIRRSVTATLDCNQELFRAQGSTVVNAGWYAFYPYRESEDIQLPAMKQGDALENATVELHKDQTKPPKRYTEASLIKELEKQNLGTKATRAAIIDNLYQRNYTTGKSIEVTTLGLATIETLEKHCPAILDAKLTRHFEKDLEQIIKKKKHGQEILDASKKVLGKILADFKKNEKKIGEGLLEATKATRQELSTIGVCPTCKKGNLVVKRGPFGLFAACNQYPACTMKASLPSHALIKPTDKVCGECHAPQVLVIRAGKRPWNYCINKQCPAKIRWREEQEAKKKALEAGLVSKPQRRSSKQMPS